MIAQIAILLLLNFVSLNAQLEVVASWRLATFAPPAGFPGASPNGSPVNAPAAFFTGLQATSDRFFLSIPRFLPGQPISLGWVPRPQPGQHLPVDTPITAFPDWDSHRASAGGADSAAANCSGLVSVFKSKLDQCGRLWVLDSGVPVALQSLSHRCQPKILAYNATTGEELYRYEFGDEVVQGISLYTNFALDEPLPSGSSCSSIPGNLFVYIADTRAPGIVVFDAQNRAAWRHDPPEAYCDPDWGVYTIAGESFTLMDAVLGITISKPTPQNSGRTVYFQPFASNRIYSVAASALRTQPTPNEDLNIQVIGFKTSQSCPLILDPSDGSLIISPVTQTAITSFHPTTRLTRTRAISSQLLQGVEDVYVEPQQIWAVSSRIQKYLRSDVSAQEVNLRIVRRPNNTNKDVMEGSTYQVIFPSPDYGTGITRLTGSSSRSDQEGFTNKITQIAILLLLNFASSNAQLDVVASWRLATFAPPAGFPGASANGSPIYAPRAFFTGVQVTNDKIFISIPRFFPGQPISLGWVPRPPPGQQLPLDTPITAFPNWNSHRASAGGATRAAANCSGLVSVFKTRLDQCGRLWVLDSGVPAALQSLTHVCQPKLLAYNATTGQELYRYEFGEEVAQGISLYTNFALDEPLPSGSSCSSSRRNFFVYIADTRAPGIVVFDAQNRAAWRHDPPEAYCDPDWGVHTIAGESFTLMDAILGITISMPTRQNNDRTVYFQALASNRIYSVTASALRARPTPNENLNIKLVGIKSSQSAPLIVDPSDGTLIISPVTETVIKSYNPTTKVATVKAYHRGFLQAVEDVFVERQQLWAVSSRIQKYLRDNVSAQEVNQRIVRVGKIPSIQK